MQNHNAESKKPTSNTVNDLIQSCIMAQGYKIFLSRSHGFSFSIMGGLSCSLGPAMFTAMSHLDQPDSGGMQSRLTNFGVSVLGLAGLLACLLRTFDYYFHQPLRTRITIPCPASQIAPRSFGISRASLLPRAGQAAAKIGKSEITQAGKSSLPSHADATLSTTSQHAMQRGWNGMGWMRSSQPLGRDRLYFVNRRNVPW